MNKKERAAHALERKIYRAIERGEFTPDYGYLSDTSFVNRDGRVFEVKIGPCGCALAAAASVNGLKPPRKGVSSDSFGLRSFLEQETGVSDEDSSAMEHGYEAFLIVPGRPTPSGPYYELGRRLRRFHPVMNGRTE